MRIEHGNPYRNNVDRNLTKQLNKTKKEIVLPEVKKQQLPQETLEEQKNEKESNLEAMNQQLDTSGKQMKAEREKLKILLNCLEISRRITGGDKVPQADHQYLMKHDSSLYARSILMRFPKNNPHEYKRLSEKEKDCQNKLQDQMTGEGEGIQQFKDTLIQSSGAVLDLNV